MKRRNFLAATALIPLFASPVAEAANKTTAKPGGKKTPARKPVARASTRKTAKTTASAAPAVANATEAADEMPPAREPRSVVNLPDEPPPQWRTYEITTTLTLPAGAPVRLWLPLAQYKDTAWQRSLGHRWRGNFASAGIHRDPVAEMEVFHAEWEGKEGGSAAPTLEVITRVATQDRHFDITRREVLAERTEVLRHCLQPTAQVPTDGLVRRTAERAIGRMKDPVAQAKAIYEWVVEHSTHDPRGAGFGSGNIVAMLDGGHFSGKSADIALLFVALCRSMGIPARPVFGLRIDGSRLFGSLGASGDLAQAQHCRAEFYGPGYGWIPVDPSDVRKAIQEEALSGSDSRLAVLRKLLFGFWEMNWISYNAAQDIGLPGSPGAPLPFLALPHAENADGRFDSLRGGRLGYTVAARRSEA